MITREDRRQLAVIFAILLALIVWAAWPSVVHPQTLFNCPSSGTMSAISYASASITSGVNTTLTVPTNALLAVIIATPNIINMRDDGTAPTGSAGMPIPPGVAFPVCVGSLAKITFTAPTGMASTLNVMFYR